MSQSISLPRLAKLGLPHQHQMALQVNTFFYCECAFCREFLDPENVDLFLAVSSCHPNPGRAEWRVVGELRLLCLGHTAASNISKSDKLPGMYLFHPYCNDVFATADQRRSLFECFRALSPVLHEDVPNTQRVWPWHSSRDLYTPILTAILSDVARTDPIPIASVQRKLGKRLKVFGIAKENLPSELTDMILEYLPVELALALEYLSGGSQCLVRLRQDPIARLFERAFQVLGHEIREARQQDRIKLESHMTARFVEIGGIWYLQDLYARASQDQGGPGPGRRVKELEFSHSHDREPYIAVQPDGFGITHIAFHLDGTEPRWISPNKVNRKAAFFQDRSGAKRFEEVKVISDVRGFFTLGEV